MKRFKSILFCASGTSSSDAARRRVEALAAKNEALLQVVDVLACRGEPKRIAGRCSETPEAAVTTRLRELEILVMPARRRGVAVHVEVLKGSRSIELIRAVVRNKHDLVVLIAEDEAGGPGQPLGRTALCLLRDCPCPVWVINGQEHALHRRVLAALDADEDWSGQQQESLRVLELAASVAESGGSELRIVYSLAHWSCNSLVRWSKDALSSHRHRLDELLAKCDLSRVRHDVRLEREATVEVVAALCEDVDVLVMGTVWRSGPAGVLIADAATEALARVNCSVLAVKPERFITPVPFAPGRLGRAA